MQVALAEAQLTLETFPLVIDRVRITSGHLASLIGVGEQFFEQFIAGEGPSLVVGTADATIAADITAGLASFRAFASLYLDVLLQHIKVTRSDFQDATKAPRAILSVYAWFQMNHDGTRDVSVLKVPSAEWRRCGRKALLLPHQERGAGGGDEGREISTSATATEGDRVCAGLLWNRRVLAGAGCKHCTVMAQRRGADAAWGEREEEIESG